MWSFPGPYSVRMRENMGQKNSKYGHFSRSDSCNRWNPSAYFSNKRSEAYLRHCQTSVKVFLRENC